MQEQEKLKLGEFYKEIRRARKIKQNEVACEGLSTSMLSKFESGQSMLSADRMLLAIDGIRMSYAEFAYALNDYQERDFVKKGNHLAELFAKQDKAGLEALLAEGEGKSGVYARLDVLLVKGFLKILDNHYEILEEDKKFLTTYLYEVEHWTEYELYLFIHTASFISRDDLYFLGKALLGNGKRYMGIPSNKRLLKYALLNLISETLSSDTDYYTFYFISALEKLLNYKDTFISILLTFIKKISSYKHQKDISIQEIKDYIKSLDVLNNPQLTQLLELKLHQYLDLEE